MTGIVFSRAERGMLKIDRIIPACAASQVGLRVGDLIAKIGDRSAAHLRLAEIRKLFRQAGSRVTLEIQRDKLSLKFVLTLTRLI